ncbi:MAG: ADP-ribosylglycohydrolase family protein [Planctomycetota bacterium]
MLATINDTELRPRMIGCWLGKAVGGTLGMPYEGVREVLNLTYYDPVPEEMLPNDDLDLQVIYAFLLDRMGDRPHVDRRALCAAWEYIGMSPDEYGIVKRNLKLGLRAPECGAYDNPFVRGMGAAIRTELWACLAPGNPDLAVKYAYEDACMDHADEGIDAAVFLAALESLAFIERDRDRLLDAALLYLPGHADSELAAAIIDTRAWWEATGDWREVQHRLAEAYLNDNFTDVVINLAYVVLGWLAGQDFGEAICIAVNCGQDTDCTGATLGALLGILDPEGIDDRWLEPIGRDLVLSPCVRGVENPPTLDGFTDLVLDLRRRIHADPPPLPRADPDPRAWRDLGVPVRKAWADHPATDTASPPDFGDAEPTVLPGCYVETVAERGGVLRMAYRVTIAEAQRIHVMFNTPQPVRVWWQDRLIIDSAGGSFVPALHRTRPKDQIAGLSADAGTFDLMVELQSPGAGQPLRWCVAVADDAPGEDGWPVGRNWLTDAFERVTSVY